MKMTLDEAIAHCLEVTENCEEQAKQCDSDDRYERHVMHENAKCAADHRQLAEWLTELKDLRDENKVLMPECDRLIKEKGELLSKVSGGDVLRICQLEEQIKDWKEEYANLNKISYGFYEELKEAKRLLKAAVEDIHELLCDKKNLDGNGQSCNICSYIEWRPCCKECTIREDLRNWRYADEALALIGEDTNVPATEDDTNVGHKRRIKNA